MGWERDQATVPISFRSLSLPVGEERENNPSTTSLPLPNVGEGWGEGRGFFKESVTSMQDGRDRIIRARRLRREATEAEFGGHITYFRTLRFLPGRCFVKSRPVIRSARFCQIKGHERDRDMLDTACALRDAPEFSVFAGSVLYGPFASLTRQSWLFAGDRSTRRPAGSTGETGASWHVLFLDPRFARWDDRHHHGCSGSG